MEPVTRDFLVVVLYGCSLPEEFELVTRTFSKNQQTFDYLSENDIVMSKDLRSLCMLIIICLIHITSTHIHNMGKEAFGACHAVSTTSSFALSSRIGGNST